MSARSLSAVGEAIERYSAARFRTEALVLASYRDLGDRAVDPRRLCLYAEHQHSQPGFPFQRFSAPGRSTGHAGAGWTPVRKSWSCSPTSIFSPREDYFSQVSSNGLAAGGDLADAGLRALFELVERDAFMLTWMCQLPVRRVILDPGLEAGLAEVIRQMTSQGIQVELYAVSSGIALPTIVGLGVGDGVRWPGAMVSLATHASPVVAAGKAILELAHVAPYLAEIMRTRRIPVRPDDVVSLEDHALYYAPRERLGAFDFMRQTRDTVALGACVPLNEPSAAGCARLLAQAGVRVALVDVTSPDVALSPFRVVRAIGTDMQPIHFGHRLQRLGNPRLQALLAGRLPNPNPHPLTLRSIPACKYCSAAPITDRAICRPSRAGSPGGMRLTGILSRGGDRSRALARQLAVSHFTDLSQVPRYAVDAAIVAVPGEAGAGLAHGLLARGVHMLAEASLGNHRPWSTP